MVGAVGGEMGKGGRSLRLEMIENGAVSGQGDGAALASSFEFALEHHWIDRCRINYHRVNQSRVDHYRVEHSRIYQR